jgi:hypothetical protein
MQLIVSSERTREHRAVAHSAGVEVRISLTDLGAVQWPARPLVGGGDVAVPVAVPTPGMTWTRRKTVPVPLGAGVADRITTVARLQRMCEFVVLPLLVLLVLLAFTFIVLDWSDTVREGRNIGGILGLAAFVLVLLGYVPLVVATATKTPRIAGGELRLPAAHEDVAREAVALNPSGTVQIHSK